MKTIAINNKVDKQIRIVAFLGLRGLSADKRKEYKNGLRVLLSVLRPDNPEDGTSGFIAYSRESQRVKIKSGKFFSSKLGMKDMVTSDKLQFMSEKYLSLQPESIRIEIVQGQKIQDNYKNAIGGNSCMTGYGSDKVQLYVDNPETYSQLTMFQGNNSARAMYL
jgi:hypothetical protein